MEHFISARVVYSRVCGPRYVVLGGTIATEREGKRSGVWTGTEVMQGLREAVDESAHHRPHVLGIS